MPSMSKNEAMMLIRELKAQDVADADIRSRLKEAGFELIAISNMLNAPPEDFGSESYDEADVYYSPFERSGCLSAYLILRAIGVFLLLGLLFMLGTQTSSIVQSDGSNFLPLLVGALGLSIIQLLCISWLWHGKARGYYGILTILGLAIVVSLVARNMQGLLTNAVEVAIVVALVHPQRDKLE